MVQTPDDEFFTPFEKPFSMPFFYDAVSFFWTYFKVPIDRVEHHLKGTGLTAARFSDLGDDVIVSLNFQNYLSNLGFTLTTVLEVEFNIHSYPTSKEAETPLVSFRDYIHGQEQTKWIGGFRLHVPADDQVAVDAGTKMFGERKFLTQFAYNVPVPNNPTPEGKEWPWDYWTFDPSYTPPAPGSPVPSDANFIYRLRANLEHLGRPVLTNPAPLTLYSLLPGGAGNPPDYGRLNASRWNILGLDQTWFDTDHASRCESSAKQPTMTIDYGKSDHEMRRDMESIIGNTPACAIRYFQSQPAAIENRAFWVDPE